MYTLYTSDSLRINEGGGGGGGGLAGAQSVKLYLGARCMYIPQLKSRCTETDSEQFFTSTMLYPLLSNQLLA